MLGLVVNRYLWPCAFDKYSPWIKMTTAATPAIVNFFTANKNDRVIRPGRSRLTTIKPLARIYPAFFSGAPADFFFSIARFSSSARGDSAVAFAFSKNASRPR
jgi:hypothetical protein